MKKIALLTIALGLLLSAKSQEPTSKEKAESLAKNEFSKSKHIKIEKDGMVKQKNREVISTPVIKTDLSFYHGNYFYNYLKYNLKIREDAHHNLMATLSINHAPDVLLKNVTIKDAYFSATKLNTDGTEEFWEGVFVDKDGDGTTDFGLGIKLSKPIQLTEGLHITWIFLKKVLP